MSKSRDQDTGGLPPSKPAPEQADIGLEPFFSLQEIADANSPEEQEYSSSELPLLATEEEPTIRERVVPGGEIPAFHALAIDSLSEPDDPFDEPSDGAIDTQTMTAEMPTSGEVSELWTSGSESEPAVAPAPPLLVGAAVEQRREPRGEDSWGALDGSDVDEYSESGNTWDTMGDDVPLTENLEDSLEWDRSQGQDTADLLSMTGVSMPMDTAEVREPSDDDRWVALSVDEDEASVGGDSISIVGGADTDLPDPAQDTVVERMALGFARETGEQPPPELAADVAEEEPSIPSMIVEQGIDAFRQGDRAFALSCFEQALRGDPDDSRAQGYLELTHDLYVRDHLPGAGLHSVPRLRIGREMLMTLELDPQAGGVLAMIDGMATVEELETMLPYFARETIYGHLAEALSTGLIEFDS